MPGQSKFVDGGTRRPNIAFRLLVRWAVGNVPMPTIIMEEGRINSTKMAIPAPRQSTNLILAIALSPFYGSMNQILANWEKGEFV
jgi:hypothetical protein